MLRLNSLNGTQQNIIEGNEISQHQQRLVDIAPTDDLTENRFKAMPAEIKLLILGNLEFHDVISLMLVTKYFYTLLRSSQSRVSQTFWQNDCRRAYPNGLFKQPDNTNTNWYQTAEDMHRNMQEITRIANQMGCADPKNALGHAFHNLAGNPEYKKFILRLLEIGSNILFSIKDDWNNHQYLCQAVRLNDVELTKAFISLGAFMINGMFDHTMTLENVMTLIDAGVDINEYHSFYFNDDMKQLSFLAYATLISNIDLIKILIARGADVSYTALKAAIVANNLEALPLFAATGVDLTPCLNEASRLQREDLVNDLLEQYKIDKEYAFITAVKEDDVKLASLLLKLGVDVNCTSEKDDCYSEMNEAGTPCQALRAAHSSCFYSISDEMAELLISHNAILGDIIWYADKHSKISERIDDLNAAKSPLYSAARRGNSEEVIALVANGADVNDGVMVAARHGHYAIAGLLLKLGGDLTAALIEATYYSDIILIKLAIMLGVDVNALSERFMNDTNHNYHRLFSNTALTVSINRRRTKITNLLLENGADAAKEGKYGDSAYKFAKSCLAERFLTKKEEVIYARIVDSVENPQSIAEEGLRM